ncbi:alpha/beta fold hydrolase [Papillibacter cinnamivorans]|uniref:Pimeloyl-ACP methyl ester carboxylesterase n=1 Tax=Papillibacter cinnamivorans DSM 12816 TaxID=1122930 RepID=A0A1W2C4F0_9FIRM|nr:alpha/beta hydrolase [Papillibacter cinnamivorans]SMC79598.1 Pimeloyl-ACP methyl ester carboxylesterase [Papillibacter cinnamivorans DSM 12816]
MPFIIADGKKIFYEIHGEHGDYILMLNGLMMTTGSWLPLLPTLKENFRVICLDMHDMGQSEKMDGDYKSTVQVDAVRCLADHLGIRRMNLCGTSYGGTIALLFALRYPERTGKVMVFNTLAYADAYLTEVGRLWQKGALSYDCDTYYDEFVPFVYSPAYFEAHKETIYQRKEMIRPLITKEYCDSIVRLSKSVEGYDIRSRLGEIQAPVLVVGCDQDYLTPMPQQRMLAERIPSAKFVLIPGAGHGVVFEDSYAIVMLMLGWFREIRVIPVF